MLVEVGYVKEVADPNCGKILMYTVGDTIQVNLDHVVFSEEECVKPFSKYLDPKTNKKSHVVVGDMKVMRTVMSNGDILYLTQDLEMLQQEEYRK